MRMVRPTMLELPPNRRFQRPSLRSRRDPGRAARLPPRSRGRARRTHAENVEEVGCDFQTLHAFRLTGAAQREVLKIPRGQTIKGRIVAPPVEVVRNRDELVSE